MSTKMAPALWTRSRTKSFKARRSAETRSSLMGGAPTQTTGKRRSWNTRKWGLRRLRPKRRMFSPAEADALRWVQRHTKEAGAQIGRPKLF
jgi:hypothetical protein